jgi:cyclopropane fatty-acyl-phospholipid synthase-like methyltransferase
MDSSNYLSAQLQKCGLLMSKFFEYQMLAYAIKSGLFDLIEHDYLSLEEIKEKLNVKCNSRNFQDLLDMLYVNHHLLREGRLDAPKYKTSQNAYLKSNPNNIRPPVLLFSGRSLKNIPKLEDYFNDKVHFETFTDLYTSEENTYNFLRTMIIGQTNTFMIISTKFDFSKYKTLCDIGGGLGGFAVFVKRENPSLDCTTFDLPKIEPLVKKYLAENSMEGKVHAVFGDMFVDEFPKSDIIAMGNIIHDWGHEKKQLLFRKAFDSINDGGIFMIVESFLDDERKEETRALNVSYLMFTETREGFNVSIRDILQYATEAGFKKVENLKDQVGTDLAICYKRNLNNFKLNLTNKTF